MWDILTCREQRLLTRLMWMGILLSASCTSVQRDSRTRTSLQGGPSHSSDRGFGCDGDLQFEAQHKQAGGIAKIEHQNKNGLNAGGHFAAAYGEATVTFDQGEQGERAQPDSYTLLEPGAYIGYDFEYWGADIGLSTVFALDGDSIIGPGLRLRAGLLDQYWGEIQMGGNQLLQNGSLFSAVFRMHPHPIFRGEIGLSLVSGAPILRDIGLTFARRDESLGGDLFLNVDFALEGGFGLLAGGRVGLTSTEPINGAWHIGIFYEF